MTAQEHWKQMIVAEHEQSERMRAAIASEPTESRDHWRDYAQMFRAGPHRTGDNILDAVSSLVASDQSVIDVGAGGGRFALPLALRCRQVTAVEPSPSMGQVLLEQAIEYGIKNVALVQATWDEAVVEPADLVFCCNVLYTIQEIGPFVRKMEADARDRVLVVLYNAPPQSQLYPLWGEVHGEQRIPLPSLPQFQEVLAELGITAEITFLPPQHPRGYDSIEQAAQQISRRLYLPDGSEKRARLERLLPERLVEVNGAWQIKDAAPLAPALVFWHPDSR